MKKQRVLYLCGMVGAVCLLMGVLFFAFFQKGLGVAGSGEVQMLDEGWLTAVSSQLKDAEYAISTSAEHTGQMVAYEAPNRAQNLRTYFSETGVQVQPRLVQGEDWRLGLELVGLGDGTQMVLPEMVSHSRDGNRVTLDYGEWQAWYINMAQGVEQGFTVESPLFAQETGVLQVDMAVTGDLVPQFVSEDEIRMVTAVGEQILSYYGLTAFDTQGAELPAAMELIALADGQTGIRLAVDVAEAEYPVVVDPFLGGGVDWEGWINQDGNYGFSVSTAGDVNGDGFDDVLVGANWFDLGQPDEGAVFAYYGGPDGLQPGYQWRVEGTVPNMELGYQVNPAGDVNGDGFADIIVGTRISPTGKAFVYAGSVTGLNNQPLWVGSGEQAGDGFGTAVNTAGDVNGDTYDDIIIGAPYFDTDSIYGIDEGRAYVFSGEDVMNGVADPAEAWRAESDLFDAAAAFGYAVGTAGDVDQNGYDDVIIGAPYYDPDGEVGYAGIFSGTAAGLTGGWDGPVVLANESDWNMQLWSSMGAAYGFSVGTAGDVNGDGYDDVVVGAPQYDNGGTGAATGAVFVHLGTNPINYMPTSPDPAWMDSLASPNARLGHEVGTAGDVDLDGYDDVIAGAPQFDNDYNLGFVNAPNGGGAFVYRGGLTGFVDSWELSSNEGNAKLGTSVGTAGDVNGDGYADVIIGAPEMTSPVYSAGAAFSVYGSGMISGLQAFNDSPTNLGESTLLWTDIYTGGILGYDWDLGNGALAYGEKVDYVYPQPGYYTAIVTATSLTDQMTATTAVTVSASSLINPVTGGSFSYVNGTTGFGTGLDIPPGAVTDTLKLTYTPLTTIQQPSPDNSLGYYFDLNTEAPDAPAHQLFLPMIVKGSAGGGETAVGSTSAGATGVGATNVAASIDSIASPTDSYVFAKPVTVTIVYNDDGLTLDEELRLKLLYWNKDLLPTPDWVDIVEECNDLNDGYTYGYQYHPNENYFTVQVCHLSQFGVIH